MSEMKKRATIWPLLALVWSAAAASAQCTRWLFNVHTERMDCAQWASGLPGGAAGGALAGTYPNPTLAYVGVNPQTGTSYAIVTGDRQKLVTLTNANPIAISIAQAGSAGFPEGWETTLLNSGVGTATITPAVSTIEGAATFTLSIGQSARIVSNGTNYRAMRGRNTLVSADIPNNAADTSGKASTAGTADTVISIASHASTELSDTADLVRVVQRSISFSVDGGGSVIPTGDIRFYPSVNFPCTINKAMVSADASGSVTVDVWKAAGVIPTSANKISASAPITLSSAQLNQDSDRTGWTNTVTAGDVFGFDVKTVATVKKIIGQIWCQ